MLGRTAGINGTDNIDLARLRILKSFGMRLLAIDPYSNPQALESSVSFIDMNTLIGESDAISLHCPLTPENKHLLNITAFQQMKDSVMINTSRDGLIDSGTAIEALKMQKIGSLEMDVYEN